MIPWRRNANPYPMSLTSRPMNLCEFLEDDLCWTTFNLWEHETDNSFLFVSTSLTDFLRARKYKLDDAVEMLTAAVEWRREYQPLQVDCHYCHDQPGFHCIVSHRLLDQFEVIRLPGRGKNTLFYSKIFPCFTNALVYNPQPLRWLPRRGEDRPAHPTAPAIADFDT